MKLSKLFTIILTYIICFTFNNIAFADLTDGLKVFYTFNGNADDKSGNNNHGWSYGAIPVPDKQRNADSAYHFDGVDDVIKLDQNSSIWGSNVTIVAWVKFNDFNDTHCIMESWNSSQGYGINMFYYQPTNDFYFQIKIAGTNYNIIENASSYTTNTWYLFVQTFDGSTQKAYINGSEIDSNNVSGSFTAPNSDLAIGSEVTYNDRYFKGEIDQVRIYNRALSNTEIQTLYNSEN